MVVAPIVMSATNPLRRRLLLATALTGGIVTASIHRSYREKQHPDTIQPFTHGLGFGQLYYHIGSTLRHFANPESAHVYGIHATSLSRTQRAVLGLVDDTPDDKVLGSNVLGLQFPNPLIIAAGYDKNADAIDGLLDIGFGAVEIGSVTPVAQPGNDKPRVFRLNEDDAIINRYGFNSIGIDQVTAKLRHRLLTNHHITHDILPQSGNPTRWFNGTYTQYSDKALRGIVGLNLGKNKLSEDAAADYVAGIRTAGPYADYVVVNVSSPNTPGLRDLQGKEQLRHLLGRVKHARDAVDQLAQRNTDDLAVIHHRRPLLVKVAPDLTEADKQDIVDVVLDIGIDGIIVSNTTLARPATLQSAHKNEIGGLSGKPLFQPSTVLVADMYRRIGKRIPIVGVGGIASADDAYQKIRAGASLIQLYTAFAYQGPVLVSEIKKGLKQKLKADGFSNVSQAVGVDANKYK